MWIPCDHQLPKGSDKKKQIVNQMTRFSWRLYHVAWHGRADCRRSMLLKACEYLLRTRFKRPASISRATDSITVQVHASIFFCSPVLGLGALTAMQFDYFQSPGKVHPSSLVPRLQPEQEAVEWWFISAFFLRGPSETGWKLKITI